MKMQTSQKIHIILSKIRFVLLYYVQCEISPASMLCNIRFSQQQKCAEECMQLYGIVTYDLNAAKPAWQIQVTESPRFENM